MKNQRAPRKLRDAAKKLRPGDHIPIYLDWRNAQKFEEWGTLLRPTGQKSLTFFDDYEKVEEEYHPSIYEGERWLVEFITWQRTVFRTYRWIRRLVRPSSKIREGGDSVMSLYTTYQEKFEILPETDHWE